MSPLREKLSCISACQPEGLEACSHLVQAVFGCNVTNETLSELYDLCIEFLDSSNLNEAVTSAAAALVFLGSSQHSELVLRQFTQSVFLQLAAAAEDWPNNNQVLQPLTALLASSQAWSIAYEILLCAHDSLVAQPASQTNHSSGSCSISTATHRQQPHEATRQISVQLPVPTATNAIRELVAAAVRASTIAQQQKQAPGPAVQQILHHCIGPLFTRSCELLASPAPALRKAAFQQLLPALLQAAEAVSSTCRQHCMHQLWQQCLTMIAAPTLPRRMGLAVLLQYYSEWPIQPPSPTAAEMAAATQAAAAEAAAALPAADSSEQFWALLRDCLVDSEALNRKRAFRIMQLLLPDDTLQQQPLWGVFTALYELLDEFSPHLVKASWPLVSQLHPVAPDFASSDAESDVAISNQINLLKVKGKDHQQQQEEQGQAVSDGLPLSFCWSQVLWTRALQHKNLQVQRMALKTLLKRSWSPAVLSEVPPSFITAVLLPALLSSVHYKVPAAAGLSATGGVTTAGEVPTTAPPPPATAAAAGGASSQQQAPAMASAHPMGPSSSSSSSAVFSVMQQGADLLARYTAAVEPAVARDVLSGGLDMLAAPGVDMPRSGLLVVLRSLAAAAAATGQQGSLLQDLCATEPEGSLNKLQALLARLATYAGQTFRVNCYDMLLTIAAAVAPLGPCSVAAAARLLHNMPSWMQSPGGPLNHSIKAWLLGSSSSCEVLREGVTNMFQQYFSSSDHQQQHWHPDATDYTSWRCMADAWIRVIVSCDVVLQQQLAAAASDLSNRVGHLISRSYLAPGAAEKALVMMTQLFECAESAGGLAREAAEQLPVVTRLAVRLAEAVAEPLGATLVAYCQCYRCKPADMAGNSSSSTSGGDVGRPVVRAGLSASAWAAAARAEVATRAAAAGAVVLARWISDQWSTCSSNSSSRSTPAYAGTPNAAQQHALPALLQLLSQLAHVGNQISAEPLPNAVPSPTGAAMQQSSNELSAAAAAEQSRASALKVLCHAALGITRSLLLCPDIPLHITVSSTDCTPVQWINAVIRETAAAHATQLQRQQAAAAEGAASSGVPQSWSTGDMDWKCLDAVMMLTAVTTSNRDSSGTRGRSDTNGIFSHIAATAVSSTKQSAPAANIPAPAGSYSSTRARSLAIQISDPSCPFLLPGVLSGDVVAVLFHQCLSAVQWVSSDHGSDLVQLLRCIRRVWGAVVEDQQLQVSVHQTLAAAGLLPSPDSSSRPISQLAAVLANGLLDLLRASKKRPQIMYSLIINTLLIPQLLCPPKTHTVTSNTNDITHRTQEDLAVLHEGPGAPLRRFIQGLLAQGCKGSPRLMLALGLQLGAAVSVNPQVAVWYCDELRQLVVFGGANQGAGGEEMTLGLSSVEDTLERQLLSGPLDPELQAAYTLTDIGPRVAVCCGLYQLAEQAGLVQHSQPDNHSNSSNVDYQWIAVVEAAGVVLWQNWLQSLLHDPVLNGERFKVGSDIHRLKVRAWQGMATLANFISSHRQRGVAAAAVRELLNQLTINNPPSIKQYQEAVTAHLLLQHQGLMEELLLPQFASVEKGNTATGSHILIAVQVALHSPLECQTRVLPVLVKQLLPWTNHHTHNIRTFAQLGFCAIMDTKPLDEWAGWRKGLGAGGAEVLRELLRFMHDNTDFQRFRKAMGAGMLSWSPVGVTSPRRIFSSTLHLAGAEETPVTFEGVPETLMDRLVVFLAAERAKLREAAVGRVAGYEGATAPHGPADSTSLGHKADKNAASDEQRGTGAAAVVPTSVGGSKGDFQRKVSHHERAALLADVLEELENAGGVAVPAGTQRHDLIVVASLISKAPNLGGLARTAEVLGARALVIGDKRLATEAGFTSVSVTAERWVPLIEVGEAVLIPWLAKKQAEGYTLVGLEQTAASTCLPSYKFAIKTVLVLGREKEGIPPEIIAMLDATVEIPQLGVIRSLNVHVSGAIAMYEYAKQQLPGCRN